MASSEPNDDQQQQQQHQQPLFLLFARFDPLNPSEELPLSVGRPVLLLNRDESPDWWFGRDLEDGREGWFPANHGSIQQPPSHAIDIALHTPTTSTTTAAHVIDPPLTPTPVAEDEGAAAFVLLNEASARMSVDLELPTPPAKPQWMLSSPSQQQQGAGSASDTASDTDAPAAAPITQQPLVVPTEAAAAAARPSAAEAAEAAQEMSVIARAMRELEEATVPKKRTMTRFSFLGGVTTEASPVRKPSTSNATAGEKEEGEEESSSTTARQQGDKRGVLDKRPSYAERFSCLIGMEGSRGGDSGGGGGGPTSTGQASQGSNSNVVPSFEGKGPLLRHLLRTEAEYASRVQEFKAAFIDPVEKRDTEDRRRLRALPKLAVALELFAGIGEWNAELLRGLEGCCCSVPHAKAPRPRAATGAGDTQEQEGGEEGEVDIARLAELMARAAPGLRLYATYASNHAGALHDLHTQPHALNRCLKATPLPPTLLSLDGHKPLTVERALSLPCLRLPQYQQYLAELMTFVSQDDEAFEPLRRAYQLVAEETKAAAASLREQDHQLELLRLQQCFLGHVEVFAPQRRLLLEGWVHKVVFDRKEQRREEQVYMHLFSDALAYSTRFLNGTYQLRRVVNLRECQDLLVYDDCWGYPTECELVTKRRTTRLRVGDPAWVKAIQGQISRCREEELLAQVQKQPKSAEAESGGWALKSPAVEGMDRRGKVLAYMYASEATYLQYLRQAIRGVSLFSQLTEGRRARGQIKVQAKLLGTTDMQIFIKAYPQLEIVTAGLVAALHTKLETARTDPTAPNPPLLVADAFLGVIKPLAAAYASYAGAYEEATQVLLARPEFRALTTAPAIAARLAPLTLAQHLHAPFDAMDRYATQLLALLEATEQGHPDYAPLLEALALVRGIKARMDKTLAEARMFRRIQAIRDSILVLTPPIMGQPDPLASLVSTERRLLKEGTLLKACRAKDKPFRFWLFDDSLLYCSLLPATQGQHRYQFHRRLPLVECQIRESRTDSRSLEVLSPKKSFALVAATPQEAAEWTAALRAAVAEARTAHGPPPSQILFPHDDAQAFAPLYVQESDAPACHLCHQPFSSQWLLGAGQRRFHCRACGQCVCGPCSGYRMRLPNLHPTQKQRVCVACFKGGKPVLGIEDVSGSGGHSPHQQNQHQARASSLSSASSTPTPTPTPAVAPKPPLPTLTKAKTAGAMQRHPAAAAPPKPTRPPRRPSAAAGQQQAGAAGPNPFDTTGGGGKALNPFDTTGGSTVGKGRQQPSPSVGGSQRSPNPFDHSDSGSDGDGDNDSDSGHSSGDEAATPAPNTNTQQQRPPSLAPSRRPPPPTRGLGGGDSEGLAPTRPTLLFTPPRGAMPLAGMAAVLAELQSGGKKGLKRVDPSVPSSSQGVSPPRGARPMHEGLPTGPELLMAIQAATKGLRKVETPSPGSRGPPPPPAGSLLEELTEAMERRRKWLEDYEEEGGGGGGVEGGVVRMCVAGGAGAGAGAEEEKGKEEGEQG